MKKSNVKYFLILAVAALGIGAVSMYSCEKETILPNEENLTKVDIDLKTEMPVASSICGEMIQQTIVKADGKVVGEAYYYNDTKYFYVILSTGRGYYMQDAYMDIQNDTRSFPTDKDGNPHVSEFKYSITGNPLSNVRKFRVDLSEMQGKSYISVTAQIRNFLKGKFVGKYERAWIEGRAYGTTEKGRMFLYTKSACLETQETGLPQ